MRVLFDQGTPVPIRSHLAGHEVRTASQEGWDTLKKWRTARRRRSLRLRRAADDR